MGATLRMVTLGCRVNQYETEYVRQGLLSIGYREAAEGEPADLLVVNTCTVTAEGDAKSRQLIRRLAAQNPGGRMVVMGCYASRAPREVAALPGVSEVVTDKRELGDLLGRFGVLDLPAGLGRLQARKRAYVKVQDGCLLRCSFCVIPLVRPYMYSRPESEIVAEVRRLVEAGHQEVVLCGIHLGHYGVDFNRGQPRSRWVRLAQLVDRLAALEGSFRIRLSSIEATEVTRELLAVMAAHPRRVCPHLHVPVQSGSDEVLRRMRRRWGAQRLIDRCLLAQAILDQPALSTDVMVGFPGETEADFETTCRTLEQVGFCKLHVFPFSPRPGTAAAAMPGQLPAHIKRQRIETLAALEERLRARYLQQLAGRPLQVLVEGCCGPHRLQGTACRYVPVEVAGDAASVGQLLDVVARRVANGRLLAERYPEQPSAAGTA
jgi:threonylcarbamoyladenosine tRNA methylthiotransferase MtaB